MDVDQQLIDEVDKQRQDILRLLAQEQPRQETRVTPVSPAEEARIRESLRELLERLPFRNAALLRQALTHTSYKYENPNTGEDNEQLEFLGDALLTFLSADFLYKRNPDLREGEMTNLRKNLVDNSRLAQFAEQLQLGQWIKLGRGEEHSGGRTKSSLLSNAFEAVVGAYYLDSEDEEYNRETILDLTGVFCMVSSELISTLKGLSRSGKLHIMQILISELAQQETDLIKPNQAYPVWSPYDAFEAADTMLKVLHAAKAQDHA